ncbi:hypothetical protein [Kutzneria kofuensis]|jgi:hypothetical protein|uniref:Uncharacterized protein n=1 Tax=Kutzneria kofuensis TaxID=103725 RepID=A0A7W9KC44_9PSEU|nr:hypothetical protein [Kutzneria kofuensis]MBB5889875.1 hypothetical protein [Kutzneria kofuensis]
MADFLAVVVAKAAMILLEIIAVRVAQVIFARAFSSKVATAG